MITAIRGMSARAGTTWVSPPRETLIDICVHSQDIAVPLHRELPMTTAAPWRWRTGSGAGAGPGIRPSVNRGLRFVATDIDWAVGKGVDVRGPIRDTVLLLTGRDAAAGELAGWPGVR